MAEETGLDLPTDEEIDQMKLGKLTRLLQELGMTEKETDDLNLNEARAELKKRIRDIRARAEKRRRPGQTAAKILDTHNSKRRHMAELCQGIAAYLTGLDKSDKDNLKIQFDREVKDITKDVQGHLDREECPILVAGETSSGKSTFLNLLLEEDILPVAHESSTSTICEVKYGETRQAVVHLHKPTDQGQWQVVIPLDGTEEHQVELKSYMHLEGARRDDRVGWIEIFLPLPLLKGGIVLVDSPGVGESEMMDKVVADYIPKSFAFLYIIDSSRAGGVQKDRFGRLLDLYAKENAKDFDSESAMFICNKWDTVLPRDQDKLKKSTLEKLSEMWPGLEESQVFFASTRKALGLGRILSEDFIKVLDGLDLLLPKSLDIKLETQHRLLTRLLSAALTHINVQLNVARQNLTKGAKLKRYQEAKEHPQLFQVKETQGMDELKIMLRDNLEKAKNFLSKLVRSGELKDMMTAKRLSVIAQLIPSHRKMRYQDKLVELVKRSTGEDFPRLKDLYEALPNTLAHDHCPSFQRLITSLETSFERKLKEVAKSLENVHQQAMASITGTSYPVPHMEVRGSTMSSLQRRKCEARSSTTSILQRCWRQEPAGTTMIDILMQAMSSEELIAELAEVQMQPQRDLMALLEDDITKMRSIMELEIDQTFKDTRSNEDIVKTYKPQRDKINSFLGQLALFHLIEMRKYQSDQGHWYDLDSITGWTDTRNKLGAGSFGDVYRVQVQWKGAETPAALKLVAVLVPNATTTSDITSKTAWEFLKEEENLRNLQAEHIVEYYGTACKREGDRLRLGLVMELCAGTLADRIVGKTKRDRNPAWWGADPEKQAAAFSYTRNLAVQLCEGLKHIHDAGYMHRDLKLINILVTKDDTVKLADFGLTKREVNITGTVAGTLLYAAPEVKEEGKMYDKSADIYSLGLILWEMWYGRTLYGIQDSTYIKHMEEDLKKGRDFKMPRWEGTVTPIPEWTRLIHDCLKKDPRERPKIQECLDRISAMKV